MLHLTRYIRSKDAENQKLIEAHFDEGENLAPILFELGYKCDKGGQVYIKRCKSFIKELYMLRDALPNVQIATYVSQKEVSRQY